jgi:anthranilate synthase component 2
MKILMLDNYDSFTYNLVGMLEAVSGISIVVKRNDEIGLEEVAEFDKIILSPGPGLPQDAGIMMDLIHRYGSEKSILGICLGMQAIGLAFGGKLKNLKDVFHGVSRQVNVLSEDLLFSACSPDFMAGRYHSWVLDDEAFPDNHLKITAVDELGLIMGIRHRFHDVCGLQFHPESILTPLGHTILKAWIHAPVQIPQL